jgi:DNA-binding CsgD family transcriptional regulator
VKAEQEKSDIIKADEIKRKSTVTYGSIALSILVVLVALLLINRQQLRRKKDKIIYEKETSLLHLEKQKMEDELAKSKVALEEYVKSVVKKNEVLEQLWVDFENMKNQKVKDKEEDENRIENLEHINKATILTDNDWDKFKELFEQVHKGFFIRLKEKLAGLTPAEIRLICLTKLNLETKQMAGMLGVSIESVRTLRYRLRKKLGLTEDNSLNELVESV